PGAGRGWRCRHVSPSPERPVRLLLAAEDERDGGAGAAGPARGRVGPRRGFPQLLPRLPDGRGDPPGAPRQRWGRNPPWARPVPRRVPGPGVTRLCSPPDWFHLVGLLHDLGKVLVLFGEPQWAVVGDTFPVGCKVQKSVVYGDSTFHENPDTTDPRYSTEYGMYQPGCGLDNVLMSWGHDEYMYQVMKFNKFALPKEAFYMVRFHSFYPWHAHGDYGHLCSEEDRRMLPWLRELNKFDLYTKQEELPDVQQLRAYYQGLIDKYCPGQLCW
uniref:Inositol oxygenase n=1 Tax=Junco hyemalis TaxID=40217 RepID=A0A8C5JNK1_JUNHY